MGEQLTPAERARCNTLAVINATIALLWGIAAFVCFTSSNAELALGTCAAVAAALATWFAIRSAGTPYPPPTAGGAPRRGQVVFLALFTLGLGAATALIATLVQEEMQFRDRAEVRTYTVVSIDQATTRKGNTSTSLCARPFGEVDASPVCTKVAGSLDLVAGSPVQVYVSPDQPGRLSLVGSSPDVALLTFMVVATITVGAGATAAFGRWRAVPPSRSDPPAPESAV